MSDRLREESNGGLAQSNALRWRETHSFTVRDPALSVTKGQRVQRFAAFRRQGQKPEPP